MGGGPRPFALATQSQPSPPIPLSATLDPAGLQAVVQFDKPLEPGPLATNQFTAVGPTFVYLCSAAIAAATTLTLTLTAAGPNFGQPNNVSFEDDAGDLRGTSGAQVADFDIVPAII